MGTAASNKGHRGFGIVFVLGAPGAGKGTLSVHLAQKYDLMHYSVGDSLRRWMRENRATKLAAQIQTKLDNQGFLSSEDLNPFLCETIIDAFNHDNPKYKGIVIDGFPRCTEQLESFDTWPFQDKLPLAPDSHGQVRTNAKPDLVLSLEVTKRNAKARYLNRGRDDNDSEMKFEKRFAEYEIETSLVEEAYRQRGILIGVDMNGTREENITTLEKKLEECGVWQKMMVDGNSEAQFLVREA